MKLYIYDLDSSVVVAISEGETNEECETKAYEEGYSSDYYGWTYSPAFDATDGLAAINHPVIL